MFLFYQLPLLNTLKKHDLIKTWIGRETYLFLQGEFGLVGCFGELDLHPLGLVRDKVSHSYFDGQDNVLKKNQSYIIL